ncbi:protein kinase [Penicillium angulare]|uniref:Protein kinase n=1 Tax=Penicillium angulare TaxID=116970 RepID=A0A9W9FCT2_9EURO|nr:protein kinase [Penicillium angulare]
MGLPPLAMIERSDYAKKFFDASAGTGKWRDSAEIHLTSLEEVECILDCENQVDFLRFMRRMLKWEPNERASAKDLLSDPWLRS